MPMVEVWVDDAVCDDSCAAAKERDRLEDVIAEAVRLLRAGESLAALHALTNDPALPVKRPEHILEDYQRWKDGRLPGFTNYRMLT